MAVLCLIWCKVHQNYFYSPADKVVEIKKAVAKEGAKGQRPFSKHRWVDTSNYVLVTCCCGNLIEEIKQDAECRMNTWYMLSKILGSSSIRPISLTNTTEEEPVFKANTWQYYSLRVGSYDNMLCIESPFTDHPQPYDTRVFINQSYQIIYVHHLIGKSYCWSFFMLSHQSFDSLQVAHHLQPLLLIQIKVITLGSQTYGNLLNKQTNEQTLFEG